MPRFILNAKEYQIHQNNLHLVSSYQLLSVAQIIEAPIDRYFDQRLQGNEFLRYAQGFVEALIALEGKQYLFDYQVAEKLGQARIQAEEAVFTSGENYERTAISEDGSEEYTGDCIVSIDLYPTKEFK